MNINFMVTMFPVRHVACTLLYCCEPVSPTEGTMRKQILVSRLPLTLSYNCCAFSAWRVYNNCNVYKMASKTGRTWLDCKNPQMADHFLRLAVKVSVYFKHQIQRSPIINELLINHAISQEPGNTLWSTCVPSWGRRWDPLIQRRCGEGTASNPLMPGRVGELRHMWCSTPSTWIFVLVIFGSWGSAILTD